MVCDCGTPWTFILLFFGGGRGGGVGAWGRGPVNHDHYYFVPQFCVFVASFCRKCH